jgi:hypothetical protein
MFFVRKIRYLIHAGDGMEWLPVRISSDGSFPLPASYGFRFVLDVDPTVQEFDVSGEILGSIDGGLIIPAHSIAYAQEPDTLTGNGALHAHFQLDHCDLHGEVSGNFEYFDEPLIPNTFDGSTHLERAGVWSIGDVTSGSWAVSAAELVHGQRTVLVPEILPDLLTQVALQPSFRSAQVDMVPTTVGFWLIRVHPAVLNFVQDALAVGKLSPELLMSFGRVTAGNSSTSNGTFSIHSNEVIYLVLALPKGPENYTFSFNFSLNVYVI